MDAPTAPEAPPQRAGFRLDYRPGLDGLRAVAILLVLWHHAIFFPSAPSWAPLGGFFGVDLFFVLSGFLITSLLVERQEPATGGTIRRFYWRRIRRLVPVLVVYLAAHAVYAAAMGRSLAVEAKTTLAAAGYVSNWGVTFDWGLAVDQLHLWSLAIEEQFYLVWPWVLFALWRVWQRAPGVVVGLVTAGVLAVSMNRAILLDRDGVVGVLYRTDTRVDALLLGAALALALHRGWRPPPWLGRWAAAVGALILGIAVVMGLDLVEGYRGLGLLAVDLGALLLVLAVVVGTAPGILSWRPLVILGRWSYSLYLWHRLVYQLVPSAGVDSFWPQVAVGVLASVVVAALSYRFIELPCLAGRAWAPLPPRRRWSQAIASALARG